MALVIPILIKLYAQKETSGNGYLDDPVYEVQVVIDVFPDAIEANTKRICRSIQRFQGALWHYYCLPEVPAGTDRRWSKGHGT